MLDKPQLPRLNTTEPKKESFKQLRLEKKCKRICKGMLPSTEHKKLSRKVVIGSMKYTIASRKLRSTIKVLSGTQI